MWRDFFQVIGVITIAVILSALVGLAVGAFMVAGRATQSPEDK